jgi:hypothetical protein
MTYDLRPLLEWLTSMDTAYFLAAALLFFLAAIYSWAHNGFGQPVKIFLGAGMLILTVVLHMGTIFYWHSVERGSIPAMYALYPVLAVSDGGGIIAALYMIRVLAFPLMGWPACVTIWGICAAVGIALHSI